jgi:DnaK suppressor protein
MAEVPDPLRPGGRVSPEEIADLRAQLEAELRRLLRSMEATEAAARPVELDQQAVGRLARMGSLQNQHLTQNLKEREQIRVTALAGALKRIEGGTYGICVECEEPIPAGRLMVMPEAEHCSGCAG